MDDIISYFFRGNQIYEPPRYLTASAAAKQLITISERIIERGETPGKEEREEREGRERGGGDYDDDDYSLHGGFDGGGTRESWMGESEGN